MIDLTSAEEALKHLNHLKNTYNFDIEKPMQIYKSDYRIEVTYLGNTIYLIDTHCLDMTINEFFKKGDNNEL